MNNVSIITLAKLARAGSEGLLLSPYLNEERALIWNSNVRGDLFGLSLRHKKEHLTRVGAEVIE